jgi:ubiquinone/menaquinone biosynthesis C-methylase UbiE
MSESAKTRHIKDFFDEDSRQYLDERYPSIPTTCVQFSYLVRKQYVLEMLDAIGHGGRVLDIGCGPAVYTRDLVERGWNVYGMDISTGMLETAVRLARALPRRVKFAAAHATHLPYQEGAFDAVMCIGVVSYVTDVPALLREVRRMLRPGGQAVFQISNALSVSEIDLRVRRGIGRMMPRRRDLDAHDRFRENVMLNPYTPATFDRWCEDALLERRDFRFFDFRPPLVIDRLAPKLSLGVGRALEALSRSRVSTGMAAGYLVRVSRGTLQ